MNMNRQVLIIESDAAASRAILEILAKRAINGAVATTLESANEHIESGKYGLIFLGVLENRAGGAIFDLIEKIRRMVPEAAIILTARVEGLAPLEAAGLASGAIQAGCSEFMAKPLTAAAISEVLGRYMPAKVVNTVAQDFQEAWTIVGSSNGLGRTIELAGRIAPTSVPVLISGESGTGKELLSHLIHNQSRRSGGPLVKVNCAALNDSLLESELFGHEKGAFTGAYIQRKGRFEQAHNGTIVLDEITETGARFQSQLLRVLESNDIQRVGSSDNVKVNVRIISTTNRSLAGEVKAGKFRADLYYRIAGVKLTVPPLRERCEDIPMLVWHFVNLYAHECGREIRELDGGMLAVFARYSWPGNIRQLRNVVRSAMILGAGPVLALADTSWLMDDLMSTQDDSIEEHIEGTLEAVEQKTILSTLKRTSGNQAQAARILGISDRTLRDKVKKYKTVLSA